MTLQIEVTYSMSTASCCTYEKTILLYSVRVVTSVVTMALNGM